MLSSSSRFRSLPTLAADAARSAVVEFDDVKTRVETYQPSFLTAVINMLVLILLIVVVAAIYRQVKGEPRLDTVNNPERRSWMQQRLGNRNDDGEFVSFAHGLFGCFDNTNVCLISAFCPGIRWADTARMAGWMTFWVGILVVCLVQLGWLFGLLGWGLTVTVGVYFRQMARQDFQMRAGGFTVCEDCLAWTFCPWCAVAQEAQQYEDAWDVAHPVAKHAQERAMERNRVVR
uniref:Uncharacterized protein n=1 Tax=Oxyrrhis marina TaxID=2969 RepID=A0A7S4GQ51_OXYMA|mmetsp:Transcript_21528/g.52387  ORF Transcript_21528/g.52387 Transcript_21528/m.52387 type:complete len:232 (+) Transcript_21528:86-781(+)